VGRVIEITRIAERNALVKSGGCRESRPSLSCGVKVPVELRRGVVAEQGEGGGKAFCPSYQNQSASQRFMAPTDSSSTFA
jgi:hypothetical protein